MIEQYLKNTIGELTFQLCVANHRIDELTKELEKKVKNEK